MRRLLPLLGSCLGMTIAAGVAWFAVNQVYTVNGVGLLARQEWPLNDYRIALAAGAAIGLVRGAVGVAGRRRRSGQIAATAGRLGLAYETDIPRRGKEEMPLFAHWSAGRDRLHGTYRGVAVELFDLTTNEPGDEGSVTTHRTVVLLPADGLPAFDLQPRPAFLRLLHIPPLSGEVTFDPAGTPDPATRDVVARFADRFILKAAGEDEPAVRRLFGPRVMAPLNDLPGWSVQSHGGRLALACGGPRPASARIELLAAALAVRAALLRGGIAASAAVPALPPAAVAQQEGRLGFTALGGGVGLFAGFAVGSAGSSAVFFADAPGKPGPGFFLAPLIFFGATLGGGALGALLGARVPVRGRAPLAELTPEDAGDRSARHRAVGWGGVAGAFAGFFGGGVLFFLLLQALGPHFGPKWLESALFFGMIFGGLVCGGFAGGFAAHRLGRARQRRSGRRGPRSAVTSARPRAAAGPSRTPAVALFLLGGIFASFGGWWGYSSVRVAWDGERVPGTVIGMDHSDGAEAPKVRYQAAGRSREIQGRMHTSPPAYTLGERVTVLYPPDDPGAGRVESFTELWLIPLLFGGVGAAALAGGLGVLVVRARRQTAAAGAGR